MIERGHADLGIVENCSMKCVSCSHAAPFAKPYQMAPEELERDLAAIKPFIHFQRLQMVGGEPTLHKDIAGMMRIARASGVGNEIMVITNGQLLRKMPDEFWRDMDSLQLSIYPKLDLDMPAFAKAKCEEYGKAFFSTTYTEFHQQFRSPPNDGAHFATCHWRNDCWTLHRGAFYFCPQSAFFPKNFMGLPGGVDGLPLEGITEENFAAFLNRTEPLNACRMCMANEMKTKPWAEAKNRDEWVAASTQAP